MEMFNDITSLSQEHTLRFTDTFILKATRNISSRDNELIFKCKRKDVSTSNTIKDILISSIYRKVLVQTNEQFEEIWFAPECIKGVSIYATSANCKNEDLKSYQYYKDDDYENHILFIVDDFNEIEISEVLKPRVNYKLYIESKEWNTKRKERLKLDNYKCKLCSANGTELHVHHNSYENLGNEPMEDLITLCKECHSKFHNKDEVVNNID